ncbi:hypothetical protein [Cellvibrio fibrivorans]|uniref:Solute-binding protein family 3/N-terminal domain-containing protein n=1 Tax=Cellvibrio fibrivorans TaxID=126350 RepID=A0ABU1UWG0_9GAMM|nr:hypothetical protein [Cellvibrio fibrivorans]MDR7089522.1 hypothetical protein [Cellvibrio fibrivorans]
MLVFIAFYLTVAPVSSLANDVKPLMTVVISRESKLTPDHDDYYFSKLLELALAKTASTHGPYQIKLVPVMPITNRLLREIELGRVDITWMPYNRNAPAQLMPIKIRLLKNLSDHRVFLIRADDQARFSQVKSIEDLRRLRGGIGSHWPDRSVMEENGLPLVLSLSYFNLFKMLVSNRFDYYSRGIHQVLPEVSAYADKGLALERELLLRYENPVYFYVNKSNTLLAERLSLGLKIAVDDGSFDALFHQFENFTWAESMLKQANRRVIPLSNFSFSDAPQ